MSSDLILERRGAISSFPYFEWTGGLDSNTYECKVLLCPESEGGFSAHAVRLPGVVSEGETETEALANIADAYRAALQSYRDSEMEIPWSDEQFERPEGSKELWILVDV